MPQSPLTCRLPAAAPQLATMYNLMQVSRPGMEVGRLLIKSRTRQHYSYGYEQTMAKLRYIRRHFGRYRIRIEAKSTRCVGLSSICLEEDAGLKVWRYGCLRTKAHEETEQDPWGKTRPRYMRSLPHFHCGRYLQRLMYGHVHM